MVLCTTCGQNDPPESGEQSQAVITEKDQAFTTFDGYSIADKDEGKGRAVLLLHGFINSAAFWDKSALKEQLLTAGYRVIVPDLRGINACSESTGS